MWWWKGHVEPPMSGICCWNSLSPSSHLTTFSWHSKSVMNKAYPLQKDIYQHCTRSCWAVIDSVWTSERSGCQATRSSRKYRTRQWGRWKPNKNNRTKQIKSECSSAMKQCDCPLRWRFSFFSLSVVKECSLSWVKYQRHWPGFEISAAESIKTHCTKHRHSSNSLCVQCSLWISESKEDVRWSSEVTWGLRSEWQFIILTFLSDQPAKSHGVSGTNDLEEKEQRKNNRAGVGATL